jgi:hypothetical protein
LRARRGLAIALAAAPLLTACFDLFHGTDDIKDACDLDASASDACAQTTDAAAPIDAAPEADAAPPAFDPSDFCKNDSSLARAAAERACVLLGACAGPLGANKFGTCMVHAILAYDCATNPDMRVTGKEHDFWKCMASAKDCDGVGTCAGVARCDPGAVVADCPESTTRAWCNGDAGLAQIETCAAWGQICLLAADGGPRCVGPASTGACTSNGCAGKLLVDCDPASGNDRGTDCSQLGAGACASTSSGPSCAPTGATCAASGGVTCDGGVAIGCATGALQRVDCAKLTGAGGGVCVEGAPAANVAAACFPPNGNCDALPDTCNGRVLKSCHQGVVYTTTCAKGCASNVATPDGPRAACAPP